MSKKKNRFKNEIPPFGEILAKVMDEEGLTEEVLAKRMGCVQSTISYMTSHNDWHASDIVLMSHITSHNFRHDFLPEPPENMVPASVVEELTKENKEKDETIHELRIKLIERDTEIRVLKEQLDKK